MKKLPCSSFGNWPSLHISETGRTFIERKRCSDALKKYGWGGGGWYCEEAEGGLWERVREDYFKSEVFRIHLCIYSINELLHLQYPLLHLHYRTTYASTGSSLVYLQCRPITLAYTVNLCLYSFYLCSTCQDFIISWVFSHNLCSFF